MSGAIADSLLVLAYPALAGGALTCFLCGIPLYKIMKRQGLPANAAFLAILPLGTICLLWVIALDGRKARETNIALRG